MRGFSNAAALLLTAVFSTTLTAQDAETTYTYATYFYCDTATQEKADELVMKNSAPHFGHGSPTGFCHTRKSQGSSER